MDILELILYSFVAYVLPRVVPALSRVFLHVHVLRGDVQVSRIDRSILAGGIASATASNGHMSRPADGSHLLWCSSGGGGGGRRRFPIVAVRSTAAPAGNRPGVAEYTLYAVSRTCLDAALGALQEGIRVIRVESLNSWSLTTAAVYASAAAVYASAPAAQMHPRQESACASILARWDVQRRCCALLTGVAGGGKTETAIFLADALRKRGISPKVVFGFSMVMKGASLLTLLPSEIDADEPYLLVLDEIDVAFKKSLLAVEGKTEASCLADNKASLCNELDRLAKLPNLIVIMTSNCTADEMRAAGYEPYIRHGRVDVTLGRGQVRQPGDHIRMFFCVHPRNDARDDVADDLPGRFVIIDEPARDT